jgi:hypothetical protein
MAKALNFKNQGRGIHTAFARQKTLTPWGCSLFTTCAVRTMREGLRRFRLDHTTAVGGAWLPWEPVTDTVFSTRREATTAARIWARETERSGA